MQGITKDFFCQVFKVEWIGASFAMENSKYVSYIDAMAKLKSNFCWLIVLLVVKSHSQLN